jgi:hypothetical protein
VSLERRAAAIGVLRAAYPRQAFPDESVSFYARKLRDLDPDELLAAIDRLTNRSSFLPSVAEIRREVAEARLNLPNLAEAWEIAMCGSLRDAPAPVRGAAEYVGGRWAILHTDNLVALRAQFREQYDRLREQALLEEAGALPAQPIMGPATEQAALPSSTDDLERWAPPEGSVLARAVRELAGRQLDPPSEAEMRDAIEVMRSGPRADNPHDDYLYKAAELVLVHADNAIKEATT